MKTWWKNNLVAILAIIIPLLAAAIIFLFRSVVEHEILIKVNSHDIKENREMIKDTQNTTRKIILHIDDKINKGDK